MVTTTALIGAEQSRWKSAKINPTKEAAFKAVAQRLVAHKAQYQQVEADTGVPWWDVAVIHEREASGNFNCSLAQGDPWSRASVHVPRGRGPFQSFRAAAKDALENCAPKAARWPNWSAGGSLAILEMYNGLGYANKGVPSPYIWAGTDMYHKGKYVADGRYDPEAVDTQLGCAGLLIAMMTLDPSIKFGAEQYPTTARVGPGRKIVPVSRPAHDAVPRTGPAPGSIGDFVANIFSTLFSHLFNHAHA